MSLLVQNIKTGLEYNGNELEYIIDESIDLGEVYLDENLIYQSDDMFTESQLEQDFKIHFYIKDTEEDA
jgi:hypothetical protein